MYSKKRTPSQSCTWSTFTYVSLRFRIRPASNIVSWPAFRLTLHTHTCMHSLHIYVHTNTSYVHSYIHTYYVRIWKIIFFLLLFEKREKSERNYPNLWTQNHNPSCHSFPSISKCNFLSHGIIFFVPCQSCGLNICMTFRRLTVSPSLLERNGYLFCEILKWG